MRGHSNSRLFKGPTCPSWGISVLQTDVNRPGCNYDSYSTYQILIRNQLRRLFLDLQSLLGPVQTALVPVVLSSTGGLLCLLVQTRYGRIIDRTRELLKLNYNAEVDISLEMLFRRARYAKWSLFGLFFGISSFLTLSLIILVSILFPGMMQPYVIVSVFLVGMTSMLIGVWYEVLELGASFKGLSADYSSYKEKKESRLAHT